MHFQAQREQIEKAEARAASLARQLSETRANGSNALQMAPIPQLSRGGPELSRGGPGSEVSRGGPHDWYPEPPELDTS